MAKLKEVCHTCEHWAEDDHRDGSFNTNGWCSVRDEATKSQTHCSSWCMASRFKDKQDKKTNKNVHYVIYAEWCVDYEGGSCIVGVYHSEEKAKEAFRHRVDTDDKILANDYGYEIYEDSDTCFDSGENGEYVKDHITVQLIQVESNDSEAS